MDSINVILTIEKSAIVNSMEKPLQVTCEGMESYFIKYSVPTGSAYKLFNEYISAYFLIIWGFSHTHYSIVKIRKDQLHINLGIPNNRFERPTFGVKAVPDCIDFTNLHLGLIKKSSNKSYLKETILKLAFFDLLLCNEDRHNGHYNILLRNIGKEKFLYPIDHVMIFNSLNPPYDLCCLSYNETIIDSELFRALIKNRDLPKKKSLNLLKKTYFGYFNECKSSIEEIINSVPDEWNVNKDDIKKIFSQSLLTNDWFEQTWNNFVAYLQIFQNSL